MGRVVVVVVGVKTLSKDPTPNKVLDGKSGTMSDRSWLCVKTFYGVGSLNIEGSNPKASFIHKVRNYRVRR